MHAPARPELVEEVALPVVWSYKRINAAALVVDSTLVVNAESPQRMPADGEIAATEVAMITLELVRNDGCATRRP